MSKSAGLLIAGTLLCLTPMPGEAGAGARKTLPDSYRTGYIAANWTVTTTNHPSQGALLPWGPECRSNSHPSLAGGYSADRPSGYWAWDASPVYTDLLHRYFLSLEDPYEQGAYITGGIFGQVHAGCALVRRTSTRVDIGATIADYAINSKHEENGGYVTLGPSLRVSRLIDGIILRAVVGYDIPVYRICSHFEHSGRNVGRNPHVLTADVCLIPDRVWYLRARWWKVIARENTDIELSRLGIEFGFQIFRDPSGSRATDHRKTDARTSAL